jgi:hypothetical protein
MNWFQNLIGLSSETVVAPRKGEVEGNQDPQKLVRAQKGQLKILNASLSIVVDEIQQASSEGNKSKLSTKIAERNQLQTEIRLLEGKIRNQEAAQRVVATAHSNKDQAVLLRNAATELGTVVEETEKIDLDTIVDTFQDNAAQTHDFSSRLSEPLFSSAAYATNEDGQDIDEEVEMLMQQAADARTASLLGVNTPKNPPPPTEVITTKTTNFEIKEKNL